MLAQLVNRTDVRMFQCRGEPGFALESGQPLVLIRLVSAQELDGDLAAEPEILGCVDHAHATFAELVEYTVMGDDRLGHE